MRRLFPPLVCSLLVPLAGFAFNPPVERAGKIEVRIEGVPAEVRTEEPLSYTVIVRNGGDAPVRGRIRTWLNDDWQVTGANELPVNVGAGETSTFAFQALAGPRVLAGLYPVHAAAELSIEQENITLHPIAIFTAVPPRETPPPAEHGLSRGRYTCVRTPRPVVIDGELTEWDRAVPIFCGSAQTSTGEMSGDSFSAVVYALHDGSNLYFAAAVQDDEISCEDTQTPDFMNSDYVRLYLSAIDPAARTTSDLGPEDVVLAISVLGNGDSPRVRLVSYGQDSPPGFRLETCAFAARRTATGYTLEGRIPLAQIGPGLKTGSTLGANLMLGDADGGKRRGEVCLGSRGGRYWLTARSYFRLILSPAVSAEAADLAALPLIRSDVPALSLERQGLCRTGITVQDEDTLFPPTWNGYDEATGAIWATREIRRGDTSLPAFNVHPPYRKGTAGGAVWRVYRIRLPDRTPIALSFSTAIRDSYGDEPRSDGVQFRVLAGTEDGGEKEVFSRFSAAKTWIPAEVDLTEFAGRILVLKLWAGPGPAGNTVCDSGYWGKPTLFLGPRSEPVSEEAWVARTVRAIALASEALQGRRAPGGFLLPQANESFGVGFVAGDRGVIDGVLAFTNGTGVLTFRGMILEVSGESVGDPRSAALLEGVSVRPGRKSMIVDHRIRSAGEMLTARVRIGSRRGALSLAFSMPGASRDARGDPRFTRLGVGPADSSVYRVYMGFGNVVENPEAFSLNKGGFSLSTRHVGADYGNGVSLVQATDIFPDRLVCEPARRVFRLETPHDATYLLIPSSFGAFTAARHYRDLSGFRPGKGVADLLGRMCIDQWGGEYGEAAAEIEQVARYGCTHAVFVKHVWQRWGYDYRLPEIYPPRGGLESFRALPEACARNGIRFAPHDNYIDFYPDAEGFSYDHIIFNRDGTPQKAWYNRGRQAQSYRWLPHAFLPWLKNNMRAMRDGFSPTGLFIDVFSAIPPFDYYDRDGRFYTRGRTTREWRRAFDVSRKILSRRAPMLSECGHDGLIGSLDGAQADHYSADRWGIRGSAACRTPWHDMASHGSFVLFAGGLGQRYGNKDPLHGYGSDDYLSNTVIGGRNPMCDGPFSRRTVMTYWLLHDVCNALARAEFETHRFGETVYRQHSTFRDGSRVWTNRGADKWEIQDHLLPRYGFLAATPGAVAAVCEIDGRRAAYARAGDVFFVDARPARRPSGKRRVSVRVLNGEYVGNGRFRVQVEWIVHQGLEKGVRPFVHVCHPEAGQQGERIALHGNTTLTGERLRSPGTVTAEITV